MREHSYADDTFRANQLDQFIFMSSLGVALSVRLEVAEVTNMGFLVVGRTVVGVLRIDCPLLERIPQLYPQKRAYNGVQQMCIRWCCLRRRAHACHAQHWRRCR